MSEKLTQRSIDDIISMTDGLSADETKHLYGKLREAKGENMLDLAEQIVDEVIKMKKAHSEAEYFRILNNQEFPKGK